MCSSDLVTRFNTKEGLEKDESNGEKLKKKWGKYIYERGGEDPFFNPNLSYTYEEFRMRVE